MTNNPIENFSVADLTAAIAEQTGKPRDQFFAKPVPSPNGLESGSDRGFFATPVPSPNGLPSGSDRGFLVDVDKTKELENLIPPSIPRDLLQKIGKCGMSCNEAEAKPTGAPAHVAAQTPSHGREGRT